ncbi:acyltransferase [Burkholderia pseudomultivorans]|uniref:acyltransferase n=1 Tax=Burkholderia pseudomultivorans TaxID=1207504 RepID=UPI0018C6F0B9|nr:acyltransferase [Burkholderia pseudomultivorans]
MHHIYSYPDYAIKVLNSGLAKLKSPHFSLPNLSDTKIFDPSNSDHRAALSELGVRVDGDVGSRNIIAVCNGGHGLVVRYNGKSGNNLYLGRQARIRGQLGFECDENFAVFGEKTGFENFNSTMRLARSFLFVGSECSSNGVNFGLQGPENFIILCDDCMLSWGIQVRTTDSHAIFNIDSGLNINPADSVVIGPHVWLGFDSVIQKGVTIGAGSIIGARSIVTGDVPDYMAVAGVPGRIVRERVCWTRSANPNEDEIRKVMERFYRV